MSNLQTTPEKRDTLFKYLDLLALLDKLKKEGALSKDAEERIMREVETP